ncbi:MAG TPA: Gfo/Idh/MocA family oxidoreductase [Planctomycetota bacterium]|nr:Gfo/Idh/MocA family oxidoreductase [Planctomycetota bacterium]
MRKIGVGIIGYGFIGRMHAYGYRTIPLVYRDNPFEIEIVGVSTAHDETAAAAAREIGCRFHTADWRELIARDDVSAVSICSPNAAHKEQVIAALQAGKHVYCDKPLTVSYPESLAIVDAARKATSVHQMTFQNRFFPATLRAKELLESGALGRILHFRALYLHSGYLDPNRPFSWRLDKAHGGGALVDLGSHVIDLMRHLLGEFESVCMTTETFIKQRPLREEPSRMHDVEVDDFALMLARMAGGVPGVIEASRVATGVNDELRFDIHGDNGAISFNLMQPNYLGFFDNSDPGGPYGGRKGVKLIECCQRYPDLLLRTEKNSIGWRDGHVQCLYQFLRCVAEGRPASPDLHDGAAVQRVMDAAYLSAEQKRWVRVSEI